MMMENVFYSTSDDEKSIEVASIDNVFNLIHLKSSLKWNIKVMNRFNAWYDVNVKQHCIYEKTNANNIIPNNGDIVQFTPNNLSSVKCLITHIEKRNNGIVHFLGLTIDNQTKVKGFITNVNSTMLCQIILPDSPIYDGSWARMKAFYIPLENIKYIT